MSLRKDQQELYFLETPLNRKEDNRDRLAVQSFFSFFLSFKVGVDGEADFIGTDIVQLE